ncbi:MAG: class I SAM-dependent methyltransferase [Deltaproteobacteria bacterium]|nr:MAG: class I SAM-dependent methyltransferase [Deltaproteobacteria bacterium]
MIDYFDPDYLRKHYNEMAAQYTQNRGRFNNDRQLQKLAGLLGHQERVLDLGCGDGVPVCRFFAERGHKVIGIDFSERMIDLARKRVPHARFLKMNIMAVDFPSDSFDLITSFYTLFHLHKQDQTKVFRKIYQLLKPGGHTYVTLASKEYTGKDEFEGTITFENHRLPYCHYSQAQYQEVLTWIGFSGLALENLTIGGETMLWALGGKPA